MKLKERRLTGCRSRLLGASLLGNLLCKLPFHLSNIIRAKRWSCGELNAAIRFGSRKESILFTKKFIKYSFYSNFFLNSSLNSLLRAWGRFTLDLVFFSLITNKIFLSFQKERDGEDEKSSSLPRRQLASKRLMHDHTHKNGTSSDQSRPTSRFNQCEFIEKNILSKIDDDPKRF